MVQFLTLENFVLVGPLGVDATSEHIQGASIT